MTDDKLHLTDHFTVAEFDLDDLTLSKAGRLNDADRLRGAARILCGEVLEPLRAKCGLLRVTDGFRDLVHNLDVGGKPASYHLYEDGHAAADVVPLDFAHAFDWLRLESALPFDKIILEFHKAPPLADLESIAKLLNAGTATRLALDTHRMYPRCLHVQTDIDNAPRRLAYIGFTGNGKSYFQVPVLKEVAPDAT